MTLTLTLLNKGGHKHGLPAEYGATMTVKGHRIGPTTISWPRVKWPATTPILQRRPSQLSVQLPRHSDFLMPNKNPKLKTYAKFNIPNSFLVKNLDNTYGIRVGTHKIKSRFDGNKDIEVTVSKLESK